MDLRAVDFRLVPVDLRAVDFRAVVFLVAVFFAAVLREEAFFRPAPARRTVLRADERLPEAGE